MDFLPAHSFQLFHAMVNIISVFNICIPAQGVISFSTWPSHMRRERSTESSEADYQAASSADLSDKRDAVLAWSLHYIIGVFWALWVWWAWLGCGSSDTILWLQNGIWDADAGECVTPWKPSCYCCLGVCELLRRSFLSAECQSVNGTTPVHGLPLHLTPFPTFWTCSTSLFQGQWGCVPF